MNLHDLGWNEELAAQFAPHAERGYIAARVALQYGIIYQLFTEGGECSAECVGRIVHEARSPADFPVVGDWVAAQPLPEGKAAIHAVLPRRTQIVRRAAGTREEAQVLAANLDILFIVTALDHDFSPARIDRFLSMAIAGGVRPVIVLNKEDQCPDVESRLAELQSVAGEHPVHVISARTGSGLPELEQYLATGVTVALLGSSGVGKSTLTNRLAGAELQRTFDVRDSDSKGRHTTTHRQLIPLPAGGLLMDTPGMRELQLWSGEVADTFTDVIELGAECRFRDCTHAAEPGCAVRRAVDEGRLPEERLASYAKLRKELEHRELQAEVGPVQEERQRWKAIHKSMKRMPKKRN